MVPPEGVPPAQHPPPEALGGLPSPQPSRECSGAPSLLPLHHEGALLTVCLDFTFPVLLARERRPQGPSPCSQAQDMCVSRCPRLCATDGVRTPSPLSSPKTLATPSLSPWTNSGHH